MLERPGEKQQHHAHHHRRRHLRQLTPTTGIFHHRRLRGTAIHHKPAAQRRCRIRCGKPIQVEVLVHGLVMLRRIDSRSRRALRKNHHGARGRHREQQLYLIPFHLANAEQRHQRQMRQPANHRPDRRNPVTRKIPRRARRNRGHNSHQCSWHFRSEAPQQ